MTVSFVAATTGGTADSLVDTSVSMTVPSISVGDLILCWLNLSNGTASAPVVTAAPGWALVASIVDGASPQLWAGLFYRVVQAGDTAAPAWTFSTGTTAAWVQAAYRGCDPTTPVTNAVVAAYAGSTAAKATDPTTTTVTGWIVSGFGDRSAGSYSANTDTQRGTHRQLVAPSVVSWLQDSAGDVAPGVQIRTITGPGSTSVGSSFILRLNPAPMPSPLKEWVNDQGLMYVAHRGGSVDYVEETAAAYAACHALNVQAIEISIWRTSDGVWVASHDQSTARMFGAGVDIPANPYSALTGLSTIVGGYPMARLVDLLNLYAATHIVFIDNKQDTNAGSLLDLLDTYPSATGRFVIKGNFSATATPVAARARNYTTWGYYAETDLGSLDATSSRWDLLGLNYDASAPAWAQIKAKGKKVLGHVILSATHAAAAFSAGADGIVTGKIAGVVPIVIPAGSLTAGNPRSTGTLTGGPR